MSKLKLSEHMITVTLRAATSADAYGIAWVYYEDMRIDKAPWDLNEWRKSLSGPVELYFVFPIVPRRTKFLKKIQAEGYQFDILENDMQ